MKNQLLTTLAAAVLAILPLATAGAQSGVAPADVQAIAAYAAAHRPGDATPLEIVLEGETPGDDPGRAASIITPLAAAGMTWWIETMWSMPPLEEVRRRIRQGPPRPG